MRRALDLLDSGQADGLVVAKLDRLARSVRHASAIIDDAICREWALVVLDNALDLTTPGERAMANMLATFAELERAHNPCDGIDLPRSHDADEAELAALTHAQVEAVAAQLADQGPYGIMACTSLRTGEVAGLRV